MWKRIHSNRDPRDTLYSELQKEFGTYFVMALNAARRLTAAYPKFIFGCMVLLIVVSLVLSFTIFHHPGNADTAVVKQISPVEDGFNQIWRATGDLRKTMQLRQLVDSLTAQKQLSGRDSVLLDSALSSLVEMHQTLK